MDRIWRNGIAMLVAWACVGAPAAAFDPNPDWPCVQRKVQHLSWGQMWSGPPLPESPSWRADEQLSQMVPRIAARRTSLETVEALVAELASTGGPEREERLTELFAGSFALIDRERSRIIDGIERYARKQRALSEHIDALRLEVGQLEAGAVPDDYDALDRLEELQDKLTWDTRIYDERRRSLAFVCESPVILEKRAFALARIIQEQLDGTSGG